MRGLGEVERCKCVIEREGVNEGSEEWHKGGSGSVW